MAKRPVKFAVGRASCLQTRRLVWPNIHFMTIADEKAHHVWLGAMVDGGSLRRRACTRREVKPFTGTGLGVERDW